MNGVDRTRAKQLTRLGQAAAVILAAGAVLAFAVKPGLPEAPAVVTGGSTAAADPEAPAEEPVEIDIGFISGMLNGAGEVTPDLDLPVEEPIAMDDTEPEPVGPSTTGFRFLGGFFSEKRSLAIIAGAGKQRMVREGDEIDFGFTVSTITPEYVELERAGEIDRLDLAQATGALVGTAAPQPSVDATTRIAPGTVVSDSASDRLRRAREEAIRRSGGDRDKITADYERQRQQRIEELRERGIEVDESEWRRED